MASRDDAASIHGDGDLEPEQVADYLRRHPDFLAGHLHLIPLPRSRWEAGNVVDLQQFMVERLRAELDNLRGCADDLLQTTRSNMSTQGRTHRAVLAVLGAGGFEELCRVVNEDVATLLAVDVAVLCLEAGDFGFPCASVGHLRGGDVARLLGKRECVLRDHVKGDTVLFGEAASLVQSDALVRLTPYDGSPCALLALGSRDGDFFHPGQGTELLLFLGRVIEQGLRQWAPGPG